jgi:hypothetical protein
LPVLGVLRAKYIYYPTLPLMLFTPEKGI